MPVGRRTFNLNVRRAGGISYAMAHAIRSFFGASLGAMLLTSLPACGGAPKSALSRTSAPTSRAAPEGATFDVTADKAFVWKGDAGLRLEIENVNGSIEATSTQEREVEIVARLRDGDGHGAGIVITKESDGLKVRVRPARSHAREWEGEWKGECESEDRHSSGRAGTVNLIVRVPEGLPLALRTVNGRIHVRGIGGPVEADASNGQVLLEGVRDAHASTVNGQVLSLGPTATLRRRGR